MIIDWQRSCDGFTSSIDNLSSENKLDSESVSQLFMKYLNDLEYMEEANQPFKDYAVKLADLLIPLINEEKIKIDGNIDYITLNLAFYSDSHQPLLDTMREHGDDADFNGWVFMLLNNADKHPENVPSPKVMLVVSEYLGSNVLGKYAEYVSSYVLPNKDDEYKTQAIKSVTEIAKHHLDSSSFNAVMLLADETGDTELKKLVDDYYEEEEDFLRDIGIVP